MDFITFVRGIIVEIIEFIKTVIEIAKPIVIQIFAVIIPIIITVFTYIININYYGIVTSKIFIGFMIFLLILYLIYAYLSMYQPLLLKKIIDFFTFRQTVPEKNRFKFNSNFDISIETK
jgi:hypothetical protein